LILSLRAADMQLALLFLLILKKIID
jgi:hypothetical protein